MTRAGLLLRVVLGFSLVLNGIGGPVAAITMELATHGPGAVAESAPPSHSAHTNCHDHSTMAHPDPTGAPPVGHTDCCGVGLCGCACAQLASLAALEFQLAAPALQHERFVGAKILSRPAPPLPHLIRPPIV